MAGGGGDKTERPTPKRRDKARREGRVARSVEVNSTAVLLATLGALAVDGAEAARAQRGDLSSGLARAGSTSLVGQDGSGQLVDVGRCARSPARSRR